MMTTGTESFTPKMMLVLEYQTTKNFQFQYIFSLTATAHF